METSDRARLGALVSLTPMANYAAEGRSIHHSG